MYHFPIIATEIEFYLFGSAGRDLSAYWADVRTCSEQAAIDIYKIENERGAEQHELSLASSQEVEKIISQTEQLKAILSEVAVKYDMRADFSAKPIAHEPGSGLHVHVHLEDAAGKKLYWKNDDGMSEELAHSIAGLLAKLPEDLPIFVPTMESKKRFVAGSNAPLTVSWGANNRTCAVRLPDTGVPERRIEHRVAGADADVGRVVQAVLAAIEFGLENKLTPPPQVYGDASLPMYGLPRIIPSPLEGEG